MAELKKPRKSNFSSEEVSVLVGTVRKHYKVLYGKFSKKAINKNARYRAWLDVLHRVNNVSLEKRTMQEIKNKWKKCVYMLREQETDIIDSMPLEQRLRQPSTDQPEGPQSVLQSQPLSPTKLKVTRQKPQHSVAKPPTPPPVNEEVCLRWNSHHVNMQNSFPSLLLKEQYVDVTLVSEGRTLKCHRMILSACSPYFDEVLSGISPYQHPVLFMKDIPFWILKSLLDFMYAGEVHIFQNKLQDLLNVAELLKIKGLAGTQHEEEEDKKDETLVKAGQEEEDQKQKDERKRREEDKKDERKQEKKEEKKRKTDDKVRKEERKEEKVRKEEKKKSFEMSPPRLTTRLKSHYNQRRVETKMEKDMDDDILDPLDLLEPIYEEPAKEERPITNRVRDNKYIPMKRSFQRKLKKRKYSDLHEDSPPPVFHTRKGTRSRPNVKVPKFYHPHYEAKLDNPDNNETVIERQPHANATPDTFLEIQEIKTEPLDFDYGDVIEIEDNNVGFNEIEEGETIIGDYNNSADDFAPEPLIMSVETVPEKSAEEAADPLGCNADVIDHDGLNATGITITNVQSIQENSNDEIAGKDLEEKVEDAAEKNEENVNTAEPVSKETPEAVPAEINKPDVVGSSLDEVSSKDEDDNFIENIEMTESMTGSSELDANLTEITNSALGEHFTEEPDVLSSKLANNVLAMDFQQLNNASSLPNVDVASYGSAENATSHYTL